MALKCPTSVIPFRFQATDYTRRRKGMTEVGLDLGLNEQVKGVGDQSNSIFGLQFLRFVHCV